MTAGDSVSVVIPVYNDRESLAVAIPRSLEALEPVASTFELTSPRTGARMGAPSSRRSGKSGTAASASSTATSASAAGERFPGHFQSPVEISPVTTMSTSPLTSLTSPNWSGPSGMGTTSRPARGSSQRAGLHGARGVNWPAGDTTSLSASSSVPGCMTTSVVSRRSGERGCSPSSPR